MSDEYWTVSHGIAVKSHKCRECKKYIYKVMSCISLSEHRCLNRFICLVIKLGRINRCS